MKKTTGKTKKKSKGSLKNKQEDLKGRSCCGTSGCCILSKNISTGVGLIVILTTALVLGCLILNHEMGVLR